MGFLEIEQLLQGLREMSVAYAEALHAGTVRRDGEIPPRVWSEPIKALHPIKIYNDIGNTVIVQAITNGMEYGKYITPTTSSHMAQGDYCIMSRCGPVADYRKQITYDLFWNRNDHYFKPRLNQFYELLPTY
jgi:hypothetical protein